MKFANDQKTMLIINDHIRLCDIPAAAHQYQVNGRTPLQWFIDRYRITRDKESGIVNDPNGWFDDPRDLIAAFSSYRTRHRRNRTDRRGPTQIV